MTFPKKRVEKSAKSRPEKALSFSTRGYVVMVRFEKPWKFDYFVVASARVHSNILFHSMTIDSRHTVPVV
jgi:hypothetical protein